MNSRVLWKLGGNHIISYGVIGHEMELGRSILEEYK